MKQIILSQRLVVNLLKMNDNKIANLLLQMNTTAENVETKFSYFDMVDKDDTAWSYLPIDKEEGLEEKNKWEISARVNSKIGRVVRAILLSKNYSHKDTDIENFVNQYRGLVNGGNFLIVKDASEIRKYYNIKSYSTEGTSNLHASCMRDEACQSFFSIYEHTENCVLLVLLNTIGKIQGRALVWYKISMDGEIVDYMDRIYSINDGVTEKFKKYATENNMWCKVKQAQDAVEVMRGSKTIQQPVLVVEIDSTYPWHSVKKPYMDTFRYLDFTRNKEGNPILILKNIKDNTDKVKNNNRWKELWTATGGNISSTNNDPKTLPDPILTRAYSLSQFVKQSMTSIKSESANIFSFDKRKYLIISKTENESDTLGIEYLMKKMKDNITIMKTFKSFNNSLNYDELMKEESTLVKYYRENYKTLLNKEKIIKNVKHILSELDNEKLNSIIQECIEVEKENKSVVKFYEIFNQVSENDKLITGKYVTEQFDYCSWFQVMEDNETNAKLFSGIMAYENGLCRENVIVALALYFSTRNAQIVIDKFDDIMINMSPKNIASLIKKDFFDIDILEYINKYLGLNDNDAVIAVLSKFIDFSKFVKFNSLGNIIAVDGKEHKIGTDFIYQVE